MALLTDNLLAYYKLDGDSTDATGNGHTGTDTAITYSTANGKINEGAGLNSASPSHINFSGSGFNASNFSIQMWFKTSQSSATLMGTSTSSGYANSISFGSGVIYAYGSGSAQPSPSFTPDGAWHHLVAVFGPGGASSEIVLYIDGVGTTGAGSINTPSVPGWALGYDINNNISYFNGAIDEVGYWNRQLTSSEVSQLYNSGAGLAYPFYPYGWSDVSVVPTIFKKKNYFKEVPRFGSVSPQIYYDITASAGANGSVTPTSVSIVEGSSQTFTFIPDNGYEAATLTIDGVPETWITTETSPGVYTYTYTFSNVRANHTLDVTFALTPTVTASLPATLTTSNYGWMTQDLLTTQESYAVHPYSKVKIVDDFNTPINAITPGTLSYSAWASAPDGALFGVGVDSGGNLVLHKYTDAHSNSLASTTILSTPNATWNSNYSFQRFVLRISDYIKGSYHIDVWCIYNLNGTSINVNQFYSDDGGSTFSTELFGLPNSISSTLTAGDFVLTAFTPRWDPSTQTVKTGFLYSDHISYTYSGSNNGRISEIKYYYGDATNGYTYTSWTGNIDSYDWSIHSLDLVYFNSRDYMLIAGFRNVMDAPNYLMPTGDENYGIWITSLLEPTVSSSDVWTPPREVFTSKSASALNLNQFIYPTASVVNDMLTVVFHARMVDSVAQTSSTSTGSAATITAHSMLTESMDGENFSYPTPLVYNNDDYTSYSSQWAGIYPQGSYLYLAGGGVWWEYTNTSTVADISNDIVQYSIQDTAGQSSSITLQLSNQNNMWYPNGTNTGASAIAANKKIVVEQGYYVSGTPVTVPRDVYYIDDIHQNSTYKTNTLTITGRNMYKKLLTTISRYSRAWYGPYYYSDTFNNTLQNWTQQSGTWSESNNTLTMSSAPTSDAIITLSSPTPNSRESMIVVWMQGNAGTSGSVSVYPIFIDTGNFIRFTFTQGSTSPSVLWEVYKGGSYFGSDSNSVTAATFPSDATLWYPVIIRQYDYTKIDVVYGAGTGFSTTANGIDAFTGTTLESYPFSTPTYFDLTSIWGSEPLIMDWFKNASSVDWTVGLGANGVIPAFQYFSYARFSDSLSIKEAIKHIATQAGIYTYKLQNTYEEHFFSDNYTGSQVSYNNRMLYLTNSTNADKAMYNGQEFSNGEISFEAQCVGNGDKGIEILFRSDSYTNPQNYYTFTVNDVGGYVHAFFRRSVNGTVYVLDPTPYQSAQAFTNKNIHFDLTQKHVYTVIFIDSWMTAYIDGIMIGAWCDTNSTTSAAYLTTGYVGVGTVNTSDVQVSYVEATAFWKQNPSLSINAGDDMLSILNNMFESVRAWFFDDLLARFKAIFLSSSDTSTYTYKDKLYAQGVDLSDKEYVSQVTVYGSGVQATAVNKNLQQNANIREAVVVDYSITNQQDAQTRANNELTNSNQYQSQYNPKQSMNVGAQLFDAVTVTDTGSNTSGVDSTTRVYAEKFAVGGNNNQNEFSIEIDTGQL